MSISISKIFEDLKTDKYNKQNVLMSMILVCALGVIYYLPFSIEKINPLFFLLSVISLIIYTLFVSGYMALTTHNEVISKEQVFPSIKEWLSILKNGFFFYIGNMILSMLISIVLTVILLFTGILFAMLIPILMTTGGSPNIAIALLVLIVVVTLVVSIVLYYLFILPNVLNFLTTLKFEEFFDFKKGMAFKKERKEFYKSYVLKHFSLGFLISIVPIIPIIVLSVVIAQNPHNITPELTMYSTIFGFIAMIVTVIFAMLLFPNLNGQIIKVAPTTLEQEAEYELVEDYSDGE